MELGKEPGVQGLVQLGRNAIERVAQLESENSYLRAANSDGAALLQKLRDRIAALEAEKAERERQEPAGQVIGINTVQWKGHGPVLGAKLYYAPPALREPTEEECSRIAIEAGHRLKTEAARIAIGRAMFNAVREVMTK